MIRWKQRIRIMQYMLADSIFLIISVSLTLNIYLYILQETGPSNMEVVFFMILVIMVALALFNTTNVYSGVIKCSRFLEIRQDFKTIGVMGLATLIVSSVVYLAEATGIRPSFIILYYGISAVAVLIERIILRLLLSKLVDRGLNAKRIIVVGHSDRGRHYIEYMKNHEYLNMKVVGYIHITEPRKYKSVENIGELDNLLEIAQEYVIDEIVVARTIGDDDRLNNILNKCQLMGITITMLLDLKNRDNTKAQVAMYGSLPTLKFHTVSLDESQLLAKRILDIIGSSVGLILFGIAFIIVGPLIKVETPGPVIFKQDRVGRNGRIFKIWKFRSMGVNADKQKKVLMANNEIKGHMFKIQNDPRITKVGGFIRKTSIDELPQFWNVFKGDMSLVGTRPPTVDEVKSYGFHHFKRISITPGITGNWQVSGRSDIKDFEEVVKLDTAYIESWTIWQDIRIVLKTILVVMTKKGSR